MYQPYLSVEEFKSLFPDSLIPDKELFNYLKNASRHVDTLTFNRIIAIEKLSDFRKEIVKEVVGELVQFEYDNKEVLENVLSSYSINGVSMNFSESWNIKIVNGVAIPLELFNRLSQTGLCCRSIYAMA